MMTLRVTLCWIPAEFGGHLNPPMLGLRPTIRFQRNVAGWLTLAWDVQLTAWEASTSPLTGVGVLTFSGDATPEAVYLQPDDLIELLDGYRVIAVGRILAVR